MILKKHQTDNIKEVFSDWKYSFLGFISLIVIGSFFYYFTALDIMIGNLGVVYTSFNVALQIAIALLFGLTIPLIFYKFNFARKMTRKGALGSKEGSAGLLGGFLGVLVAGCPACGITLASFIGLGSAVSVLPLYGLELKIVGLGMLIYSTYSLSDTLKTCSIK